MHINSNNPHVVVICDGYIERDLTNLKKCGELLSFYLV